MFMASARSRDSSLQPPTVSSERLQPEAEAYCIAGRCLLQDGEEFACKAYDASVEQIEIACKKSAPPGSVVVAYLDNVGIVRGRVGRSTARGFLLLIEVTDERRLRIATRLDWHVARAAETAEQRAAARIVPRRRQVEIRLGEDLLFQGTILNLSMTGAALATEPECRPYVGSLVKVGKRYASVVRSLEKGFAVQFKLPFIRETFNENVVL